MLLAPVVALLRPRGLAWAATLVASLMALAIAIGLTQGALSGESFSYAMGGWEPPYGIELHVDMFSALVLLIVTGASSIALMAGKASLDKAVEHSRQPLFYSAWLLVLSGLAGILVSADAFNIFVFMEISSLASYIVVAGGTDRRALPAVFKYLIMGTIGATFYLIGIGLIYMMTGTLNLADMELRIHDVADQRPILVAAGFITVGLALKAAVFPLHVWLPNAYTYAPHAVTAFLAACATKVSLYVLLRFDFVVFQQNLLGHEFQFAAFLMPLAVLAILAGSAVALFESNIKRLLAYSSVAQIGYILLGASLVSLAGLSASLLHMFNHALAKGTLFLAVMALAMRFTRLDLRHLAGSAQHMPWTMAAFVIAGLSLIGVPGTAGFISKWYLVSAALEAGPVGFFLIAVVVIGSLMAVVYIWRIIETAWFEPPTEAGEVIREAPVTMLAVVWLAALANIYFGLATDLPRELAAGAAASLLGQLP
ncbi:MAG: monovalent cation/H+ antiporter subunit D family protein [Xanthomonadales bacterium]|nr:monovalent cation/H+ antiporter subunit D family protein [Gammaproteobacteria bacterium]MBT8054430.1 monovalent cation/H+ antiporter subunit D family protein [Gammaproteobacteria bacterium]NND58444.1 monovalent cation/H+ antiporter subunit D family protein [Xanthomonadales bacterium]NNK50135.1 monovalent cation/H+ antiporter subunit D family protein [Xanthomonadales bacterium]NNL95188.1 monovalent cation/H+ antiporter subunit D family protein [Xanthomonadales bacterium]